MFGGPKEKYTGIEIHRSDGSSTVFGNAVMRGLMRLLYVVIVCCFIVASKEVRIVVDHLLSSKFEGVESILGQVFSGHKPAADRTANHVGLSGKKQVHHQAQEYKLLPERTEAGTASRQDVGQEVMGLEHQEAGIMEREQGELEQTGK
jgi:hypothetical protein